MIGRLRLRARSEILLSVVHLPSKLHRDGDDQSYECGELARQIAATEAQFGHRRTVVVGDFNMNPFERGLVGAGDLHAGCLGMMLTGNRGPFKGATTASFTTRCGTTLVMSNGRLRDPTTTQLRARLLLLEHVRPSSYPPRTCHAICPGVLEDLDVVL